MPLTASDRSPSYETISATSIDLPRYDYERWAGKPYRIAYGVNTRDGTQYFTSQIVKIDAKSGKAFTQLEQDMYPGEPVYLPKPGSSSEDEGVILSVVLDEKLGTSFLLLLDAKTFTEQAQAGVSQYIPLGFHGEFFSEVDCDHPALLIGLATTLISSASVGLAKKYPSNC